MSHGDETQSFYRDVEALQVQREEAKEVLQQQNEKLRDIDDKALRTVRITVLLLGVLLSTLKLFGGRTSAINGYTILGSWLLVSSVVSGVLTYSVSGPYFGPGSRYIDRVIDRTPSKSDWEITLLRGYADWLEDMKQLNDTNAKLLLLTQLLLVAGVVSVTYGFTTAL